MPDPTRPTPGRRPNQGALVVILAALMLVNLTTLGLLVAGGWFDEAAPAADEVPELTQVESHPYVVPSPSRPDRAQDTTTVLDEAATPVTPTTDEPAPAEPEVLPTVVDRPADRPGAAPFVVPQVAEQTPEVAPVIDPDPASPPLEFFGIPIFE